MILPAACLFDLDGLLLDTEPLHAQVWSQTAAAFGSRLSESQLMALKGRRRLDCAQQLQDWLNIQVGCDHVLALRRPIAHRLLSQAPAMPGAENLVRWCDDQKLPMALVTSSTEDAVALKSGNHCWLELIKVRVLGDDPSLKSGKPAADPFLLASQRLDVEPSACWAFEDSPAGTQAALAAGCLVWVLDDQMNPNNGFELEANLRQISQLSTALDQLKAAKGAC
ncbi:MAG: HAD family hydrolase [Prochlorococcus sp.]|nr:HAD family phosphatase [Prochlorococcaceae cyanobacterium ETNP18_MAG_1]